MLQRMIWTFVCAIAFAWPVAARGEIIYSTLGPGDSYYPYGWTVFHSGEGLANQNFAASFTPGADYLLTSIEMPLLEYRSTLLVHLAEDSGGFPGTVIETYLIDLLGIEGISTITSTLNPLLAAGNTYWIYTEANSSNLTVTAWGWNVLGLTGDVMFSRDENATWSPFANLITPAFRVNGVRTNIVPEPASMVGAILGVCCLLLAGARPRKHGHRAGVRGCLTDTLMTT